MYRKELADGKGMLFNLSPEQEVSMWMKNTYIPLDMIFIRADNYAALPKTPNRCPPRLSLGRISKQCWMIAGTAQKYGSRRRPGGASNV